jgi:hypothetical protein
MNRIARNWRVVLGGVAAGSAAIFGFAGASASAEPVLPAPPAPAPATVTQTVTVTPEPAAPAAPATAAASPAPEAAAGPAPATPAAPANTAAATPAPQTPAAAPTTPVEPALAPATSGTLPEFLKGKGVVLEPQKPGGFTALNIVLPVPPGWSVVPDPNVPDAFGVIADRKGGDGLYTSNAQLQVYKLVGEFDPREAISHGYVDSQKQLAWQSTSASMSEFGGFPSSIITGTYRANDLTLNTSRRYIIAKSGADTYLLSLSVSTAANQAVATATATDAILNGFRVVDPAAAPATPAPAAAPAPAPAPAADPAGAVPAPAAVPADPAAPSTPPVSVGVPPVATAPATAVIATVPTP